MNNQKLNHNRFSVPDEITELLEKGMYAARCMLHLYSQNSIGNKQYVYHYLNILKKECLLPIKKYIITTTTKYFLYFIFKTPLLFQTINQ